MPKKNLYTLLTITILTFLLSGFLFYEGLRGEFVEKKSQDKNPVEIVVDSSSNILGQAATSSAQAINQFLVKKVIDGDTIDVSINGEVKRIRLIGVDTPETVDPSRPQGCFGKEASDETKRLLEGKLVSLEKDISETDRYGRLLRYIFIDLSDGTKLFVNDYLVRQGFASVVTYPPDVKYAEQFKEAQRDARENLRGLWSKCQS